MGIEPKELVYVKIENIFMGENGKWIQINWLEMGIEPMNMCMTFK